MIEPIVQRKPLFQTASSSDTSDAGGMKRTDIVSGVVDAATDVRKACNAIKRTSALASASMMFKLDPNVALDGCQRMAKGVLEGIGFDLTDEARVQSVMPMILDAASHVIADAARLAPAGRLTASQMNDAITQGVVAMRETVKSKAVVRLLESSWPTDIDSLTAMRMSAAAAMAQVATEIARFDFMHQPAECIKEAGKVVVKAAMEACEAISPGRASPAAKQMLSQSLLNSAARIYASAWKVEAASAIARLDAMSDADVEPELQSLAAQPLTKLMVPVNVAFAEAFKATVDVALEMLPAPAALASHTDVAAPAEASSQRRGMRAR